MAILIVEDNAVNAKLLDLTLKAQGYQTVLARSGTEALATLSAQEGIQMVITDLMMPEMDGLEFIAKAKALATFNDIPVIIASAQADRDTVGKARALGCGEFVVKPIDKHQLIERVERLLKNSPVVLRGKNQVMNKLEIGAQEYDDLATTLAGQLATLMPMIVLEQGESEEPMSENLCHLLDELAEGAAILGAEKFLLLYSRCKKNNTLNRSQCPAFLKALQELEAATKPYAKPAPAVDSAN